MTSFAFILGVVPLVVATGAGAEMRRSLGTAVFSGMLGVTLFGIFLTPVFFYVIDRLSETRFFRAVVTQWLGSRIDGRAVGAWDRLPCRGLCRRSTWAAGRVGCAWFPQAVVPGDLAYPTNSGTRLNLPSNEPNGMTIPPADL